VTTWLSGCHNLVTTLEFLYGHLAVLLVMKTLKDEWYAVIKLMSLTFLIVLSLYCHQVATTLLI